MNAQEQTEQAIAAERLGQALNSAMCRHVRVLVQIHHAAVTALADEKAIGFPLPYGDDLVELRDISHAAIEGIAAALKRRADKGIV